VAALSELPKDRIEFIGKGLHHPQTAVRRAIVQTLGRMKHPLASNLLSSALEDEDAAVRSAAANAIGYIGSRYAERKLVAMARTDADPSVRRAAQRALRKEFANYAAITAVISETSREVPPLLGNYSNHWGSRCPEQH
jgi:HEAT repeat protein